MLPTPRETNQQMNRVGEQSIKGNEFQIKKSQKTKDYNLEAIQPIYQNSQESLSNCNSNKSSSKNSIGFDQQPSYMEEQQWKSSHYHTNTAPVHLYQNIGENDAAFLIKDQDTGIVYDIRNTEKIPVNREYMTKLKKRHKSAWQGWWQQKKENNQCLLNYVKSNNIKEVEKLLEITSKDLKPEINIRDENGLIPLHYSCMNQNYELALLLLKNEADCDLINSQGQTALSICAQKGCEYILSLLLTIGADINHMDNLQNTPLHYACYFQHKRVCEILLARPSIMINIRNLDGKTPYDLVQNCPALKILFDKHLKMKQDSFNLCQRVRIFEETTERVITSPNSKQHTNTYQMLSRCQSPQKVEYMNSHSNRSTAYIHPAQDYTEVIGPSSIRIILQIGKGSFGDVYLVEKRITGRPNQGPKLAMKVLPKNKFLGQNLLRYALTERNILSYLNHPFIVKLRYAFQTNTHLCLLMDFCPGGDLSKLIQRQQRLSEQQAKLYFAEILTALEHLHQNDIIYRDLKPENVVIDQYGHAMLTDFGLSKEGIHDNYGAKSFCGSMAYLAPEMLKRVGHGRAVDWYHMGILLYEMITGRPPYFSANRDEMINNIEQNNIQFPETITKECKSMIQSLLIKNPMQRLGASQRDADEIKDHPFLKQINWKDLLNRKYKPPNPVINEDILNQKFDIPFDFILSADKSSAINYINGWSFVNNDFVQF
ncbi:unnamed protein product [Paramecium primaurelia]|uniref:Protein kinase domain-containing protein n=1 Tax=Paramecium primaurelia TaxID=5886 RepID=A0A8S1LU16_PARPR|nr:unnamed protein product [Paramecium primaurelia]